MAATLFAEPPSATLDEAVEHFLNGKTNKIFFNNDAILQVTPYESFYDQRQLALKLLIPFLYVIR